MGNLAAALGHETTILDVIATVRRELRMGPEHRDAALQRIAERARSLTGATGAAIALKDGDVLVCVAKSGLHVPDVGAKRKIGAGFSSECLRTGKPLRCSDALIDSRVDLEVCNSLGVRSMIAVPIEQRNRTTGLVQILSPKANKFSGADQIILEELAKLVPLILADPSLPVGNGDKVLGASSDKSPSAKERATTASGFSLSSKAGVAENDSRLAKKRMRLFAGIFVLTVGVSGLAAILWRVWPGIEHASAGRTPHSQVGSLPAASDFETMRVMAERGEPAAQFAVGTRYAIGLGVKQDYAEAARWFTRAAEQGHTISESILSAYYGQGRGVGKDPAKAYFWLRVAQAGNDQIGDDQVAFLASQLSPTQLALTKAQADSWIRVHNLKK